MNAIQKFLPDTLGWKLLVWTGKVFLSPIARTSWGALQLKAPPWNRDGAPSGVGVHALLAPHNWAQAEWPRPQYWSLNDESEVCVLVLIERWGRAVLGSDGWRAEAAEIRAVLTPGWQVAAEVIALYPGLDVRVADITHPDPYIRAKVVERVTDQAVLARIAEHDESRDVRRTALQQITDEAVLARIAEHDESSGVRMAALLRITDQAVLARIVEHNASRDIRVTAVQRVTDQAVLARVAEHDAEYGVRMAADQSPGMNARQSSAVERALATASRRTRAPGIRGWRLS